MNPVFLDQLPQALIEVTDTKISYFNRKAKTLFHQLEQDQNASWLLDKMPKQRGQVQLPEGKQSYQRIQQDQTLLFTLEPASEQSLEKNHILHLLSEIRQETHNISLASQAIAQGKEKTVPLSHINHNLVKLQRLLKNCQNSLEPPAQTRSGSYDLAGLLTLLCAEMNSHRFQGGDKTISFSTSNPSLIAIGNCYDIRQVVMGLVTNGLLVGNKVKISLREEKDHALVTIQDENTQVIQEPVAEFLSGNANHPGVQPGWGAGLNLMALQNILSTLNYNLWVECPKSGGLKLTISVPLPNKAQLDIAANTPNAAYEVFLDLDGGYSDLLINLSPVLSEEEFTPSNLV